MLNSQSERIEIGVDEWLMKGSRTPDRTTIITGDATHKERFGRIRCPLCGWHPTASSRWSCDWTRGPEPFFTSCGTAWNTFATRGRCPGCDHQWRWTSCLSCHEWSWHEDWYEQDESDQ